MYYSSKKTTKIQINQQQELVGYVAPLARQKKSSSSTVAVVAPLSERKDDFTLTVCYAIHTITFSNYFISETSSDPFYELVRGYEPCDE